MLGYWRAGLGTIAGEHVVRATLVGRLAVSHRANHRELVGKLGCLGKCLAESLTLDLGGDRAHVAPVLDRCEWFGIECFLVRDPAGKEDMDHRVGLGRDRGVALEVRSGLEPQNVGQGQSAQTNRADRKKTRRLIGLWKRLFAIETTPFVA